MSVMSPDLHLLTLPQASPPVGWYQIILLGDRGTCVLTTCPGCTWQRGSWDSNLWHIDRIL